MIFFLLLPVILCCALIVQQVIPPLPGPWFEGARVLIMPVVLFYASLALPFEGMLFLSFVAGFLWDALTVPVVDGNVEISLGWSIVLYAILGSIMNGLRPLFRRGRWEVHCLLSGVLTAAIVLVEYLMISVRRMTDLGMDFPPSVWARVLGSGMCAALMAPIAFYLLNLLARTVGYNPQPERKERPA